MSNHDDTSPAPLDGHKRRIRWDPTINLGHVLTFFGFLATGSVAYFDLRERLAVQEVRAGLRPEEKLQYIVELAKNGKRAAMIGDGINDSPSLAAAHVGVAMGARGSDAALEQADLVLMHDRLENFLKAFDISVAARRIIRQNIAISLGVIVVLVGFALAGHIPLTLGVMGHEGSTLLVVLNSLRLLWADHTEPPSRLEAEPTVRLKDV